MTHANNPISESQLNRLVELLADQATGPLTPAEAAELDALQIAYPNPVDASGSPINGQAVVSITAALMNAWANAGKSVIPADVRIRLIDRGIEATRENARDRAFLIRGSGMAPPVVAGTLSSGHPAKPFSWPLLLTAIAACVALCVSLFLLSGARQQQTSHKIALTQLEANNQSTLAQLAASDARIAELGTLLQTQRQDANARLAAAADQIAAVERDRNDLANRLQAERDNTAELNTRLTAASDQLSTLRDQLAASERKLTAAEERIALLQQNPDSVQLTWAATEIPEAKGVTGDVVWNARLQRGYLRFKGLSQNDPVKEQYQAWIFDKDRDPNFPVDAGVFDITAASKDEATGDLIIPIDPKLIIKNPAAFAVTLETPGGVVVTDKKRVVVLAPVPAAEPPK